MSTSLSRMMRVLDLFTFEAPFWGGEDICAALGYSRTTGYRYLKELTTAAILQRLPGGLYAVGPRVAALDHVFRSHDPLLKAAVPIMREISAGTGCDCHMSSLLGQQILDTHLEMFERDPRQFLFRGRVRHPFRGAAPKVILAHLGLAKLKAVYEAFADDAPSAGLGTQWTEFRSQMKLIRKRGYEISRSSVRTDLTTVAAPVFGSNRSVAGAVQLVAHDDRPAARDEAHMVQTIVEAGSRISAQLAKADVDAS